MQREQTVPQIDSSASEASIVGSVLADGSLIDDLSRQIRPEMFSVKWLGTVWERMCNMAANDEPVDLLAFMTAAPDLSAQIGAKRLSSLHQSYISERDTRWHVDKLKEAYIRRTLVQHADRIKERATDVVETSVDELKSAIEQIALGMDEVSVGAGLLNGADQAAKWFTNVETRQENPDSAWGMLTGWQDIDKKTLGFHRGDLVIVGGYTSVGKSAFATETTIRIAKNGHKVAVFSLEMSREQVQNRIAANLSGVHLSKIRNGSMSKQELSLVSDAMGVIEKVAIMDERGLTADAIAAEMKRWKRIYGLDFVVVDYLQEIQEKAQQNDNTGSALARVARKLRKAAQQCDCTVMALSQLNREATKSKEPTMAQLSGSAGIESAADIIILLHRDKEEQPEVLQVNMTKNRNGDTGKVNLAYDLKMQQITGINDTFAR